MSPKNAIFFLRFREPQFDLFDIELNSQDLKEVGSNRVDEIQDDDKENSKFRIQFEIRPPLEQSRKTHLM